MKKLRFTVKERIFLNELAEMLGDEFRIRGNGKVVNATSNRQALLAFIERMKMEKVSRDVLERVAKIVSKDTNVTTEE